MGNSFNTTASAAGTIARVDIENIFGANNVEIWADMDNDQDATKIDNRIDWAITMATSEFYDSIRGSRYKVPFSSPLPDQVTLAIATLAGLRLHDARGLTDSGEGEDPMSLHRKQINKLSRGIKLGLIVLDVADSATTYPKIVDG